MNTKLHSKGFPLSLMTLALLAAFTPPAFAEDVVDGSVSVGLGAVSGDARSRALFGQYNGLRPHGTYGLLNFDYTRRSDDSNRFVQFLGTNVLGETRELSLLWKRQGDWRFTADYGELVRYDPNSVNTGLIGPGTATPQVVGLAGGAGSGSNFELKTKRTSLGLGFAKHLSPGLLFEASLKTENKDGARMFGAGFNCPSSIAPGCLGTTGANVGWALLMLPEPVNSNHSQVEARLNYAEGKLRLSGGYYGSYFNNSTGSLTPTVPGTLNNPVGVPLPLNTGLQGILSRAIALAPDNQAHRFDVGGSYAFTSSTRATFKLAYTQATQRQDFANAGLGGAPAGVSSLDGKVITTLAQAGITSRPLPKLSLVADLRHEDRDDRTPLAAYNVEGTTSYTNMRLPNTRTRGKLQASYQLPGDLLGTVGADWESIDRGAFTASSGLRGISAIRQKTDELGYRAELRRQMSETFSGSVSYVSSHRDGSNWLAPNSSTGVAPIVDVASGFYSTSIFMPTLANRKRDKVRLFGAWQPTDELSLQFTAEDGSDSYGSPSQYGLQNTRMEFYSVDVNYVLSETWSVNGYWSYGIQKLNQARPGGAIIAFDNRNTAFGLGVVGKPSDALSLGGGLSFLGDRSAYAQTLDASAGGANASLLASTGGLPDITFRRLEARVYGRYEIAKNDAVRFDLIHQRAKFNDWAWGYNGVPFSFSDGTTVSQQQQQNVTYLGVTYIRTWQ